MEKVKTGTNEKGIRAVVEKATKRANWYKETYPKANDFEKRLANQFWGVIHRWRKSHFLTIPQDDLLFGLIKEAGF